MIVSSLYHTVHILQSVCYVNTSHQRADVNWQTAEEVEGVKLHTNQISIKKLVGDLSEVGDVLKYFIEVKAAKPQCKNTAPKVKVKSSFKYKRIINTYQVSNVKVIKTLED